jgi:hypothetical protein
MVLRKKVHETFDQEKYGMSCGRNVAIAAALNCSERT